uniref:Putative LAGLIDADG homing endonuclease n=1 Tax=Closterium baillyanum TaxID=1416941 RepID=U5YE59_9VIRI|nr:putative LAGLIDADG homing endonuclease [Closterium baillyanum]AGZ90273.1 putative LAGLIDADG homing endonuclease [Closterium baillyanum]
MAFSLLQSARNFTRSSETIRQLSNKEEDYFNNWLAGIIDGDGNFDIQKGAKQSLRIKLHNRDIRILTRIQNFLHIGKIRSVKNKPHSIYIVSKREDLLKIIYRINGKIRLKVLSFQKVCEINNIATLQLIILLRLATAPYFAGLVDTDGSIVFNYSCNRIECNLELKYNEYSSKLNLNWVIPNTKPNVLLLKKKNQQTKANPEKIFKSIAFRFQSVSGMIPVYDYFMKNRLYSDFKFYRLSKIKPFFEIRQFCSAPFDSAEFGIYSNFVLNFIQHLNPSWTKTPFVKYLSFPASMAARETDC